MALLNNSPLSCMNQIIAQLWNNPFLSDVEFNFGEKILYGHSLLLMCRSIIFEELFIDKSEVRYIIPIENFAYNNFSEFLRFLYQDDCAIKEENTLELIHLAVEYKIPKLENLLLEYIILNYADIAIHNKIKLLEYCLSENYELLRDWMNDNVANEYFNVIQSDYFLNLKPDTVEHILKFGFVTQSVNEYDIYKAVLKWMNKYCDENNIELARRRITFTKLIHLIRFPLMSVSDFSKVIQNNRDLFTDDEYAAFFDSDLLSPWESHVRVKMIEREKLGITVNFPNGIVRYIKSKIDLHFIGLWLGCIYDPKGKPINMTLVVSPYQSVFDFPIAFRLVNHDRDYILSFGDSLLLKGNHTYSIRIHFLDQFNHRDISVDRYSPLLKQKLNPEIENSIEVNDQGNLGNIFKLYFKIPKKINSK